MVIPALLAVIAAAQPPVVEVSRDNTTITESCIIRIAPGAVIEDADGDGVIHIKADAVTVEFEAGSVLRGAKPETLWDAMRGTGIRIADHSGVTVRGAEVTGYKVGLYASGADGLTLDGLSFHDNYRQHLRSTPEREDAGDWLWPHSNDARQWMTNYGAAVVVERSEGARVLECSVRRGQNGIILDRVAHAQVYDSDCSFLSGWGLAMWRSSDNMVAHNAFDFCVRGHSEGVYNRGQDSAGILMFEQCSRNVIAENSATHGGDCFFGFAGKEAIGEVPVRDGSGDGVDEGCSNNVLIMNDLSYAPAHGIEMTFSSGNRFTGNRLVENGGCAVWGGYSRGMMIDGNLMEGNGGMSLGLERGGVNIEHGSYNFIVNNRFINNRCGVHLWWDDDGKLLALPGVKAHDQGVTGNVIAGNVFEINGHHPFVGDSEKDRPLIVLQMRDTGAGHLQDNTFVGNTVLLDEARAKEFVLQKGCEVDEDGGWEQPEVPVIRLPGVKRPVGARADLSERQNIIMGEWGPWDHEEPMVRLRSRGADGDLYEVFGNAPLSLEVRAGTMEKRAAEARASHAFVLSGEGDSVKRYDVVVSTGSLRRELVASRVIATWEVRIFPWSIDPREDLAGWRGQAESGAQLKWTGDLGFAFGQKGPRAIKGWASEAGMPAGADHYGLIAGTVLDLPPGKWRFTTHSDDGVRVTATPQGKEAQAIIENWTWHGPTTDMGVLEVAEAGPVGLRVEYFQIDGFAVLKLDIERAD